MKKGQNYNPTEIEQKWQEVWEKSKIYQPDLDASASLSTKKPFYNLMMFPYPSAEGLHVGNMYAFTGADIFGRFKRMQGFDVFEPIGLDGFGIHSENYAIKVGRHPKEQAKISEKNFYRQLHSIGNGYDWTRTVETYDPDYYKWTQWIFIQLFKKGLAYRKKSPVNFCPSCKTVLSDEQVIEGKCERCSSIVEKKELEQWFFKITEYVDRLLNGLTQIDWTEKVKIAQKNWIGRSEGMKLKFDDIEVFTTRPDTVHGATFIAVSSDNKDINETKEKLGEFTGKYVTNPATGKKIPVWEVNYVAKDYGTGAIMGVPAHDERDFEFAKKYGLEILEMEPENKWWKEAEKRGWGQKEVRYHLRDWLISRQRYWGPPIPMIYCEKCAHSTSSGQGWQPVPEEDLPVLLPDVKDWRPKGTGKSPLASIDSFVKTKCPNCGGAARRETDVSDTFLDSAWYFLRYLATDRNDIPFPKRSRWLPVDMYIGGAEHSVLHLLYVRFITMVLHDLGLIEFDEPFPRFYAHGLMISQGAKMSKSRGNVIVPDSYIKKYGADTLRTYLMFLGPFNQGGDFSDSGIEGMHRFLKRVWKLVTRIDDIQSSTVNLRVMHKTIKKVTEDMKGLRYNTAIAALMEYYNFLSSQKTVSREEIEVFLKLLAPFAPHMSEELWQALLNSKLKTQNSKLESIHTQVWPTYNPKLIEEEEVTIVVQVNGKVRATVTSNKQQVTTQKDVEQLARESANIKKYLDGKTIRKVIYVEGKIINFVTE